MQFPRCPSSATLDCRILHHGCIRKGNGLFDVSVFFPYLVGSPKCAALRLSVMNATYAKHAARTKILEVLAWSCNALGPSLQLLFFVWGRVKVEKSDGEKSSKSMSTGIKDMEFSPVQIRGAKIFQHPMNRSDIKWQDHPLVDMSFTVAYWKGCNQIRTFFVVCISLDRTAARQCFCMYCDSLQWVTLRSPINELNNLESLYTILGPREGDCENHYP